MQLVYIFCKYLVCNFFFVLAAAKHGIQSDGVELNPWLVLYSRFDALRAGVGSQTKFFTKDLWKYDISSYKYVIIFGVEQMVSFIGLLL